MTEDDWRAHARYVVQQMKEFAGPFVSPISYEKPDDVPKLSGTGSFIEVLARRFLLTNEHVLFDEKTNMRLPELAFGLRGTDNVFRLLDGEVASPYPIDCAICPIRDLIWNTEHRAATIPEGIIHWAHVPVKREILFFRGYAQADSSFHFDNLLSGSTSYATQEMEEVPDGLNERFFFALHHSPEHAEMIDGDRHLSLPPGFSGSTVWNTRYIECLATGSEWSPLEARVTGIVCRWRSGDTGILVLRVEHLRSWLLKALNDMRVRGHI